MTTKLLARVRALEKTRPVASDINIIIRFVNADRSLSRDCICKDGTLHDEFLPRCCARHPCLLGTIDPFVTAFAIANRFVSMQEAGLPGGPFNGITPFDLFQQQSTTDLTAYLADPSLDWQNTIAAGQGVPGQILAGPADLAGAMCYNIYSDHSFSDYQNLYATLGLLGSAAT